MNEKEFMTIDDLCIYLNIGRSTAYKLIKNGTIPAKKYLPNGLFQENK